ncbi:MAG: hypothetical protein K0R47_5514 [Brevibacillus sp.]|nr:hypothetical protein [Brevibacillus sp.]
MRKKTGMVYACFLFTMKPHQVIFSNDKVPLRF